MGAGVNRLCTESGMDALTKGGEGFNKLMLQQLAAVLQKYAQHE